MTKYILERYRKMKSNSVKYIVAIISGLILAAIDQVVKFIIVENFQLYESKPLIEGVFELNYIRNTGSAWGVLAGKIYLLLVMTLIILAVLFYVYHNLVCSNRYLPLRICFVFVFAGAIGNMIDRIRLGYVVDFLYFKLINFPVFNVADIYVTVSMILILLLVIFKYNTDDFDVMLGDKVLVSKGKYVERKSINKKNSDDAKENAEDDSPESKETDDYEIELSDGTKNKAKKSLFKKDK